jgi:hypothetical protein
LAIKIIYEKENKNYCFHFVDYFCRSYFIFRLEKQEGDANGGAA